MSDRNSRTASAHEANQLLYKMISNNGRLEIQTQYPHNDARRLDRVFRQAREKAAIDCQSKDEQARLNAVDLLYLLEGIQIHQKHLGIVLLLDQSRIPQQQQQLAPAPLAPAPATNTQPQQEPTADGWLPKV